MLFRPGDDRVASLFLWHFVEEVEHRSSALVIYDAVVGKPGTGYGCCPARRRTHAGALAIIADGVNAHVPVRRPEGRCAELVARLRVSAGFADCVPPGGEDRTRRRPSPAFRATRS